jgi:hypothetical protein
MNYLAGDNGVSGALALISQLGQIVAYLEMPVQKTRKGKEVDVRKIRDWLHELNVSPANAVVVIEEPGGSKSAKAATSMAGSFHALRALFELKDFKLVRVTPQSWQKPMLHCAAKETKSVALQLARSLWPGERFLASERCKVAHDGIVDACLLGEHARRQCL